MRSFRVRALQRAVWASLLVPLVAGVLFLAQRAGVDLPDRRWIGFLLLGASAVPAAMHLLAAAAGHPWHQMERDWNGLPRWMRAISSAVALVCGLTTGAAVVLLSLSIAGLDAKATEEPQKGAPQHQGIGR